MLIITSGCQAPQYGTVADTISLPRQDTATDIGRLLRGQQLLSQSGGWSIAPQRRTGK